MDPAPSQILAKRYRLLSLLAKGGMGSVWRAEDLGAGGRQVAVKLMDPLIAGSADAQARFLHEAHASSLLKSPYVVEVYDHGADGETAYIAMELLQGADLSATLRKAKRVEPTELAPILKQVCKALEMAHDAGIVHRDLKPGNIFLAEQGDEIIAKVLDFGIAKALGPDVVGPGTKTGTLLGSPHYMSPEQARRSKDVDHRTDLWALGVVVFRALTGRLPFPGKEVGDVIVRVCAEPVPVPSTLVPDLGRGVDRFIERALQRDPKKRFQSARSMAETFSALIGAPIRWDDDAPAQAEPSQPSILEIAPPPRYETQRRFAFKPESTAPAWLGEPTVVVQPEQFPTKSPPLKAAPRSLSPADSQGTLSPAGRSHAASPDEIPRAAFALVVFGLMAVATGVLFQWRRSSVDWAPVAVASANAPSEAPRQAAPSLPPAPEPILIKAPSPAKGDAGAGETNSPEKSSPEDIDLDL